MKCENYETTINRLAREQTVESQAREQTLRHLEQCAHCADALASQRAVATAVRQLAANLINESASPHVEAALRRAFRDQAGRGAPVSTRRSIKQLWGQWPVQAAIAAAIVLVLLMGLRWLKPSPPDRSQEARRSISTPREPAPDARKEAKPPSGVANSVANDTASADRSQIEKMETPSHQSAEVRHPRRQRSAGRNGAAQTEIATSFYPLVEEDELSPLESGRVVRVEVQASTLINLGLPITAENRNQFVKADLLLGQDGLARAIRFLPETGAAR